MSNFFNLPETFRSMGADPSTANDPIKRMFLTDGQFVTTNVTIIGDTGNALHTQSEHDEIVVIFDGEAEFQVGAKTRRVQAGDMIFIPRNTLHGPIIPEGGKLALLSVFAPYFDRSKKNIEWERDQAV
jgi:quercetin dioxygenase-like cupin family protein